MEVAAQADEKAQAGKGEGLIFLKMRVNGTLMSSADISTLILPLSALHNARITVIDMRRESLEALLEKDSLTAEVLFSPRQEDYVKAALGEIKQSVFYTLKKAVQKLSSQQAAEKWKALAAAGAIACISVGTAYSLQNPAYSFMLLAAGGAFCAGIIEGMAGKKVKKSPLGIEYVLVPSPEIGMLEEAYFSGSLDQVAPGEKIRQAAKVIAYEVARGRWNADRALFAYYARISTDERP